MGVISISAEAGLGILRRLASGELEAHGILLRDTEGKKFRYILRGFEELPLDPARLPNLPDLGPLQSAMTVQQVLGVVTVAQNAAVAASLRRIEAWLATMERRLEGVERRLERVDSKLDLVLAAVRDSPVARLEAARNQAKNALRYDDRTSLIAAARSAEQAARDLISQALHLLRVEANGFPAALLAPRDLTDLVRSGVEAMSAASAMHVALGSSDIAAKVMHQAADTIEDMRATLRQRLLDPELMKRRMEADLAPDREIMAAGHGLRESLHWARGRAALIDTGAIEADGTRAELERVVPVPGLALQAIHSR
jgi:hypothetical protein